MRAYPEMTLFGSVEADHPMRQAYDVQGCLAGMRWVWDDVQFEILHPSEQDLTRWRGRNASSCVLKVTSQSGRVALFTGDIERAQEMTLLQRYPQLSVDWLQVPHHGSMTSSSIEFVQRMNPKVAQIQAGHLNRFGHPREQILIRYKEIGAQVVQTSQCGASRWTSLQAETVHCEREQRKRYWHHRF
jgi:competence protein ComEC